MSEQQTPGGPAPRARGTRRPGAAGWSGAAGWPGAAARRLRQSLRGLRLRLLAALLATSAITLGVAALALLSSLEARLRADGVKAARVALTASLPELRHQIEPSQTSSGPNRTQLRAAALDLTHRAGGADVAVLNGNPGLATIYAPKVNDLNVPDYFSEARAALHRRGRIEHTTPSSLIIAQRVRIAGSRCVVIVDKHLQYVGLAFQVVKRAFIVAAAAGLGIALLLGIGLASTLLRRLERLRDATRKLEREGLDAPLPDDPAHDEIGELTRSFAAMRARLRRQEAARRAFVATASHELRTPLTSLDGMLELLAEDLGPETLDLEDARLRTEHAREQTRRLAQLATDLLDLSKLDAEVGLRSEPLELGELSRAVAAEFERVAGRREVELAVRRPPDACWAAADPGSVARIVRILIDNALRFAPPNSSVEIAAANGGSVAQISVSDAGPGVPESDRERIFERFTRGSVTSGRGGFGLGLAIGRELAQRMGGSLELCEQAPGDEPSGACFRLQLPVSEEDQKAT
ncbi:MAG TPA: HAMP domain-containing sensor histidine kinase [Solirubrobacteraceae bacterium]